MEQKNVILNSTRFETRISEDLFYLKINLYYIFIYRIPQNYFVIYTYVKFILW